MGVEVRAGGGIVWRHGKDGRLEVLVVHRPKYDDWTFPKGKVDEGESDEECALREVEEETGLVCELGAELPSTTYHDRFGRAKLVRYWAMRPLLGAFDPHAEVDEIRWVGAEDAADILTYPRDRTVLASFAATAAGPGA